MEIKELLNEIKRIKSNISFGENLVKDIKENLSSESRVLGLLKVELETQTEQLDELIRGGDETAYIDKREMEGCVIKVRKSSPAVVITDVCDLDSKYIVYPTEGRVDKIAIKEAIDRGEVVAGAEMKRETYKLVCEVK